MKLNKYDRAYIQAAGKLLTDIYFVKFPSDTKKVDLSTKLTFDKGCITLSITIKGE